jgi:methanogenic corrinoid protein MtbC1
MYRWCAYCQQFLGEKAPLNDHSLTHGICSFCIARDGVSDADAIERVRPIVAFLNDLMRTVRSGEELLVSAVVARGFALGLRPADLLVGILQPSLYEVGRLWEVGQLTPRQEAVFSSFCEGVIVELTAEQRRRGPPVGARSLVLLTAPGNRHRLGPRMVTFLLREHWVNAEFLEETPPPDELLALLEARRPALVGASLASSLDVPYLDVLVPLVGSLSPRPRVLAGGAAVRAGCAIPPGVEARFEIDALLAEPELTAR